MANVLLIEPDAILANAFVAALQRDGHSVRHTTSGQVAVDMIDDLLPDMVLLELQLVGHSGVEFLYEFRSYSEWLHIPVAIVSNVPLREFAGSVQLLKKHLGVQAYRYKPATTLRDLLRLTNELSPTAA